MTMTDPLGDMLTRIRNAQMRRKQFVVTPNSKLRAWFRCLEERGRHIMKLKRPVGYGYTRVL